MGQVRFTGRIGKEIFFPPDHELGERTKHRQQRQPKITRQQTNATGDGCQYAKLGCKVGRGDRSQSNDDDFGRQNKIGANRAFDFRLLGCHQIHFGIGDGGRVLFSLLLLSLEVQKPVSQLFTAFETQKRSCDNHQRLNQLRCDSTQQHRRRNSGSARNAVRVVSICLD